MLNLQQAIQNCIDIAAHIVAENDLGVPGSTAEMFYLLESSGCLPSHHFSSFSYLVDQIAPPPARKAVKIFVW